ncbi:MAG: hypothetical protein ACO1SV_25615 [Fimbriimonas sp.]
MNSDWIELLELLVARKVEFLVVGAWAMAYHGQPRYTGDLDIFFRPSYENANALLDALRSFGAPTGHLRLDELAVRGFTVTFGVPPSRIDLLNWLSGVDYDDAASDAEEAELGGVPVRFLSRRVLLKNKTAAARPKDLLDARILNPEDPDFSI